MFCIMGFIFYHKYFHFFNNIYQKIQYVNYFFRNPSTTESNKSVL